MASISSLNDLTITNNNLLQSPKKVIKALYDYQPQGPGELAFRKGDFFHVIGNEDDPEWYEACNPSTNSRGMVPVPYFEVFGKTRPVTKTTGSPSTGVSPLRQSPASKKLSTSSMPTSVSSKSNNPSANTLYAIVLYDFQAERSDELDIHAGENIILCAHHSYEWFIAKPIDRLGGPGLVPVSYVSVIDILTGNSTGNDVMDDIQAAHLPTVDEWKNSNAKYKASSIPLGNVDEAQVTPQMVQHSQMTHQSPQSQQRHSADRRQSRFSRRSEAQQYTQSQIMHHDQEIHVDDTKPSVVDATVDAFHVDDGRYWFHVQVELSNGQTRSLCRYYEDFYDFQIRLLELFPNEAGRSSHGHKRILPFIPGPLTYVTDKITKKRQVDLNQYVRELVSLPVYVSHSNYVKGLFDFRNDLDQLVDSTRLNVAHSDHDDNERTIVKEESVKTLDIQQNSIASTEPTKSVKLKFYYRDDIFALLLSGSTTVEQLREKVSTRIYDDGDVNEFKIFMKEGDEIGDEVVNDSDVQFVLTNKLKMIIDDE